MNKKNHGKFSHLVARLGILSVGFVVTLYYQFSVSVSPSMLVKPESKLVTPAGSCIALNMEYSPMVACHQTRLVGMTPSQPSSLRLEVESMYQELYLLT